MAVTTSNLVLGPGSISYGVVGAAEPADAIVAPGVGWTNVGATTDGVTLTVKQEFTEIAVDQVIDIVESRQTKRSFTVSTNLAELTLDNLKLALNGGVISETTGEATYTPNGGNSGTPSGYVALLIDGIAPSGKARRIIVRKALSTDDVEFAYNKEDQSVYSVTFTAHYVADGTAPFLIIDEA